MSGLVLDEVHAQPNRKLYDVLTKGSGDAREQPLYFLITTAGNDTNSICYELHQKALDLIEGRKHDETCVRRRRRSASARTSRPASSRSSAAADGRSE